MQSHSAKFSLSEGGFAHLILILSLFLVIFLIALFFLQARTPNSEVTVNPIPSVRSVSAANGETSKIYSSGNLGISFSYSASKFNAKEDTEEEFFKRANGNARKNFDYYVGYQPGEFVGAVNLVNLSDGSYDNSPFVLWVFNNPSNLDGTDWFKKYWYYPFMWGQFESGEKQKLAPVNETTIDGETASYGEVTYQAGSPKYYYVSKNGKMYLIKVIGDEVSILSSLKFL